MVLRRHQNGSPKRRGAKPGGGALCRSFVGLGFEALEERRLMHAGHDHDAPPDPAISDLEGIDPIIGAIVADPAAATHPLSSIPALASLSAAAASLFLDFDGFFQSTWGSYSNITTPVYDRDGDPATFSDSELTSIQSIWAQVSEDFAPFKINVTTIEPPSFANGVAMRVAIGGNSSWAGGNYGGIAYVNSFTNSIANTVYVFPANLSNGYPKYVAEASSHEAGHSFGLQHQSLLDQSGAKITEYYSGPGNGTAPIMGNSYGATRGLWWSPASSSAHTTNQDDLAVISKAANGFGYRVDDHANTAIGATPLVGSGGLLAGSGIITTTSDADYFSFDTGAGQVTLSVAVPSGINNLDARLELRDASGQLIASAAPSNSFGATIVANVSPGSYRAVVASQGNYGDVGQFTVSVNVPAAPTVAEVLGRALFYNQSSYDGNDAAVNPADDAAAAGDKTAYLPGDGVATFANISSFARGINGVMIDLAGASGQITPDDFIFRVGQNNEPGSWEPAPAPSAVVVRSGEGTSGSDRIEVTWNSGAIQNTWLEVVLRGNDAAGGFNTNTGLPSSDVFYFGNRIGDIGSGTATVAVTNISDEVATRNNLGLGATITSVYDFDRNGVVNVSDQIASRNNFGFMAKIDIDGSPAAPLASGADEALAVALGLSTPRPAATGEIASAPSGDRTHVDASREPARLIASAQEAQRARDAAFSEALGAIGDEAVIDDDLLDVLARGRLI